MTGFDTTPAIDWMRSHVDDGALPVAVIGLATADGVVDIVAHGTDGGRTAHVDDRFCLYSVTKPLTGLTAMRAVERGLLNTDSTLGTALPGIPAAELTLGQLLSHTSGLSDTVLSDTTSLRDALRRAPLEFIPGTARRYNNLAWEGVAALTEHATGRGFTEQFADMAAAAGASTLSFDDEGAHTVHGAHEAGHDHEAMMSVRHPAAGGVASVADLLAVGQSLLRGDGAIVSPTTLAAMTRSRTDGLYIINPDPEKVHENFGLAFNLPRRSRLLDHSVFGHEGWASTQFWISPASGRVLVLLTNRFATWDPPYGLVWDELLNAAFAA